MEKFQELDKGDGFSIRRLPTANPSMPRGKHTWEWKMREGTQVTALQRQKGEFFGNHFHKGADPSKNPERILLLVGVMKVEFLSRKGDYTEKVLDATNGPVELLVWPWHLHRFEGIEQCFYIEYRSTHFNPEAPDTYPAEDFPAKFR